MAYYYNNKTFEIFEDAMLEVMNIHLELGDDELCDYFDDHVEEIDQ
jgi:hypothetical protein